MYKASSYLLLFLFAIYACKVLAGDFDYYEHVSKYAKCEAIFNVSANILAESEEDFYRHEHHHDSLDSRIIALELVRAGNYKDNLADELYDAYLDEYKKILNGSSEVDVFMSSLRTDIEKCKQLNEMQEDIIRRKKEERK